MGRQGIPPSPMGQLAAPGPSRPGLGRGRRRRRVSEGAIHGILLLCGLVSLATTVGIIVILSTETVNFFRDVPIGDFFGDTKWTPLFVPQRFGIWPLIVGTLWVTAGALFHCPTGRLGHRHLPQRVRTPTDCEGLSSPSWRSWRASPPWSTATLPSPSSLRCCDKFTREWRCSTRPAQPS